MFAHAQKKPPIFPRVNSCQMTLKLYNNQQAFTSVDRVFTSRSPIYGDQY